MGFHNVEGRNIPAVTADEMRKIDQLAVDELGLGLLQMMENAGRALSECVMDLLDGNKGRVVVLAGGGGNGGGGVCAARHLLNRGVEVVLAVDRDPGFMQGAAAAQLRILRGFGIEPVPAGGEEAAACDAAVVVDALIGYSLRGEPRGRTRDLIVLCGRVSGRVVSLDMPSGLDATTGRAQGVFVRPDRTLTLALPKRGLAEAHGTLYLADIGLPARLYTRIGIEVGPLFQARSWIRLQKRGPVTGKTSRRRRIE